MRLLFKLHQKCTSRKDNYFLLLQKSYFIYLKVPAMISRNLIARKNVRQIARLQAFVEL